MWGYLQANYPRVLGVCHWYRYGVIWVMILYHCQWYQIDTAALGVYQARWEGLQNSRQWRCYHLRGAFLIHNCCNPDPDHNSSEFLISGWVASQRQAGVWIDPSVGFPESQRAWNWSEIIIYDNIIWRFMILSCKVSKLLYRSNLLGKIYPKKSV